MRIFETGSGTLIKKSTDGKSIFFPYGALSAGYFVQSDTDEKQITTSFTKYNRNIFLFLFLPLFAVLVSIGRVPERYNWAIVSLMIILLAFWAIQYIQLVRRATVNLKPTAEVATGLKFDRKTISSILLFGLYALGVLKLSEIVQGFIFG